MQWMVNKGDGKFQFKWLCTESILAHILVKWNDAVEGGKWHLRVVTILRALCLHWEAKREVALKQQGRKFARSQQRHRQSVHAKWKGLQASGGGKRTLYFLKSTFQWNKLWGHLGKQAENKELLKEGMKYYSCPGAWDSWLARRIKKHCQIQGLLRYVVTISRWDQSEWDVFFSSHIELLRHGVESCLNQSSYKCIRVTNGRLWNLTSLDGHVWMIILRN